jgi:SAM-dependent methyltransferase
MRKTAGNKMRVDDSGMPDEAYWNSLFDIPLIVDWLDLEKVNGPIVEIGCGYGTFTVPIASAVNNKILAFDIDQYMIETAQKHARQTGIRNVRFNLRDIIEEGTGLESGSAGMVLLFNILHFEGRGVLLEEASRLLKPNGMVAIVHWRKDIETPRGPSVHLRPDQRMILDSIKDLDLWFDGNSTILEPYHWGIQLIKRIKQTEEPK